MILSPRSTRSLALAATLLAGCGGPFWLVYCEGDGRPIDCDCARARREILGGRVGRIEVREYDRAGALRRRHDGNQGLQFVLLDRWLVIRVQSRSTRPSSLQAWLDCEGATIVGTIVRRGIDRDASGLHEHEFLALFSGSPGADDLTPICAMHVVFADAGGGLSRRSEQVYAAARARLPGPIAGLTWGVPIGDALAPAPGEANAGLEPDRPPPAPRLCRTQ